jgi:hypothetical protein
MVEGHLLAYETCVSQAEGKNVESVKAKLCCVCRMLMLMTSQCLCPAVVFRYDRKLKEKKSFYTVCTRVVMFFVFLNFILHQVNTARWIGNE